MSTGDGKFQGVIEKAEEGVVWVRFESQQPKLHTVLTSLNRHYWFEVVELSEPTLVAAVGLMSMDGIGRGDLLEATNRPIELAIRSSLLGDIYDLFGNSLSQMAKTTKQPPPTFPCRFEFPHWLLP